eukprot:6031386-Amphidinium_carterae.1
MRVACSHMRGAISCAAHLRVIASDWVVAHTSHQCQSRTRAQDTRLLLNLQQHEHTPLKHKAIAIGTAQNSHTCGCTQCSYTREVAHTNTASFD